MTTAPPTPDHVHGRRRRHLATLVLLAGLIALVPGVATLAGFTARDVNRDNKITTGLLDVSFGQDRTYFGVQNMKPGDWIDTTVDVVNSGSLEIDFAFGATALRPRGPADLDEVLRVSVSRGGVVLAENRRFSTLSDVRGRLSSRQRDVLDVRITWPENVPEIDNRYQGGSLMLDFQVNAVQAELVPATTAPTSSDPFGINGVAGLIGIDVPYEPGKTAITVVDASSTRFSVTNFSATTQAFRFDSNVTVEVWDGSGEWIITIVNPEWGWDGHQIDLAPGDTRTFIANAWEPSARLAVVPIGAPG